MTTNEASDEGGVRRHRRQTLASSSDFQEDVLLRKTPIALLLALALIGAACGSQENVTESTPVATTESPSTTAPASSTTAPVPSTTTAPEAEAAGFPVTIAAANGEVELPARPEAIVSLSSSSTEILFAIGAGDQVVAVDEHSNHPPEAPLTALSGITPNIEAIAEFEPDLVVLHFDPGGIADGLAALEIPVIVHPAALSLADSYTQVEQLGTATGHLHEAAELIAGMRDQVTGFVEEFGGSDRGLTYYHELDDTYYSATSTTFIGELYGLLGLENIADSEDTDGFGFPQLSAEYIIESDPDLIFLADTKCCGQTAVTLAERPGWGNLSAVANGAVVELDDDIASRWGPRVMEFIEAVAEAVRDLEGATTG
jgi:iron complex transport system substrate-binding protein